MPRARLNPGGKPKDMATRKECQHHLYSRGAELVDRAVEYTLLAGGTSGYFWWFSHRLQAPGDLSTISFPPQPSRPCGQRIEYRITHALRRWCREGRRRAYSVLIATVERWEAEPPTFVFAVCSPPCKPTGLTTRHLCRSNHQED